MERLTSLVRFEILPKNLWTWRKTLRVIPIETMANIVLIIRPRVSVRRTKINFVDA